MQTQITTNGQHFLKICTFIFTAGINFNVFAFDVSQCMQIKTVLHQIQCHSNNHFIYKFSHAYFSITHQTSCTHTSMHLVIFFHRQLNLCISNDIENILRPTKWIEFHVLLNKRVFCYRSKKSNIYNFKSFYHFKSSSDYRT